MAIPDFQHRLRGIISRNPKLNRNIEIFTHITNGVNVEMIAAQYSLSLSRIKIISERMTWLCLNETAFNGKEHPLTHDKCPHAWIKQRGGHYHFVPKWLTVKDFMTEKEYFLNELNQLHGKIVEFKNK